MTIQNIVQGRIGQDIMEKEELEEILPLARKIIEDQKAGIEQPHAAYKMAHYIMCLNAVRAFDVLSDLKDEDSSP